MNIEENNITFFIFMLLAYLLINLPKLKSKKDIKIITKTYFGSPKE
ncbi:MAG: hypothetical protein Q4F88_00215 [Eubacteriales bacterium]|nr:hypothetical protein [Eubacteriales bacterium]